MKKVLPDLQAAMKELEEAAIVTAHLQSRQSAVLKDHGEWLEELTRAQVKTEERFSQVAEMSRQTDERIDKLVSAIGELIRRNGGKHK